MVQDASRNWLPADMKSLGSRLTYYYALVVIGTVISTLIIGYLLLRNQLIHGIDLLNNAEFREIHDRVGIQNGQIAEEDFLRPVAEHAEIDAQLYFFQVRKNDRVLFRSPNMRTAVFEANPPGKLTGPRQPPGSEACELGNSQKATSTCRSQRRCATLSIFPNIIFKPAWLCQELPRS